MHKSLKRAQQYAAWLLIWLLVVAPLVHARPAQLTAQIAASPAQQEEDDAAKVTFDNLLPASSYAVYIEARDIGQYARSGSVSEIIEPLAPIADQLPKELDALVKFVAVNADSLMHSRLMIALEPAKPTLPPMLIAVELASPDAAQEFETKLQALLPALGLAPSPAVPPPPSKSSDATATNQPPAPSSPFTIKHAGRVLVISVMLFTFKTLRAESDKLMSDDANFRAAHDRFYAEPLFLYYDMALSMRVMKERMESYKNAAEEQAKSTEDATSRAKLEMPAVVNEEEEETAAAGEAAASSTPQPATNDPTAKRTQEDKQPAGASQDTPSTADAPAASATAKARASSTAKPSRRRRAGKKSQPVTVASSSASVKEQPANAAPPPPPPEVAETRGPNLFDYLVRMVFASRGGNDAQVEAIALALTLENDAIILRALTVTPLGIPASPIPLLSLPISGPAQSSDAASYLPADTDVFITASLDLTELYDLTLARAKANEEMMVSEHVPQQYRQPSFESKLTAFEKANGFRVRDELLATLGNEIAVGLPASYLSGTPLGRVSLKSQAAQTGPVVLIAVRNREMLEAKLKPVLEALSLKLPNEKGVTEKQGDIEITSYSQSAVTFINNYLVIGNNTATVRRVIEARAKNETLATSRDFHSYMQWQPRETIAQVYVSGPVLKGLFRDPAQRDEALDPEVKEFLARFRFEMEPITYAASADALGAFYELRLPKKLVMRVFSEIAADEMRYRIPRNEMVAQSVMHSLGGMEKAYYTKNGRYATFDGLEEFRQASEYLGRSGYKFEVTASGNRYEATATPIEYGKSGKVSYYTDQSGQVREGDHGGKPATAADKPSTQREY